MVKTVTTDAEAFAAVGWFLERAKLVTELATGSALAAARRLASRFGPDDHLVLLVCGGNVSLADLCSYRERFGR